MTGEEVETKGLDVRFREDICFELIVEKYYLRLVEVLLTTFYLMKMLVFRKICVSFMKKLRQEKNFFVFRFCFCVCFLK